MTDCAYCKVIESKRDVVYEDEHSYAMLVNKPASPGHIVLLPKKHFAIIEQVPDYIMSHLFTVANKLSVASFEGLKAEGSNILIQNGVAAGQKHNHVLIHIIPRWQQDGLSFVWQPKQIPEEQASTIEFQIKEQTKNMGVFETEEKKPITVEDKETIDEDYLLKQLERLP